MVTDYKKKSLSVLLRAKNTVFTIPEIAMHWNETNRGNLIEALRYYSRKNELFRLRRGLYAKTKEYNRLEVACRILVPAYVSFETVLLSEGIIFQYYHSIFAASYVAREVSVDDQVYQYRRMRPDILANPAGIRHQDGFSIATPERAFLDMLYLHNDYYFDNLRPLDWNKVLEMLPIYRNKRMERVVTKQYAQYAAQRGIS